MWNSGSQLYWERKPILSLKSLRPKLAEFVVCLDSRRLNFLDTNWFQFSIKFEIPHSLAPRFLFDIRFCVIWSDVWSALFILMISGRVTLNTHVILDIGCQRPADLWKVSKVERLLAATSYCNLLIWNIDHCWSCETSQYVKRGGWVWRLLAASC